MKQTFDHYAFAFNSFWGKRERKRQTFCKHFRIWLLFLNVEVVAVRYRPKNTKFRHAVWYYQVLCRRVMWFGKWKMRTDTDLPAVYYKRWVQNACVTVLSGVYWKSVSSSCLVTSLLCKHYYVGNKFCCSGKVKLRSCRF